jgi:multidrug efflux pump subunit AcrB
MVAIVVAAVLVEVEECRGRNNDGTNAIVDVINNGVRTIDTTNNNVIIVVAAAFAVVVVIIILFFIRRRRRRCTLILVVVELA